MAMPRNSISIPLEVASLIKKSSNGNVDIQYSGGGFVLICRHCRDVNDGESFEFAEKFAALHRHDGTAAAPAADKQPQVASDHAAIERTIKAAESLLEWCPVCSLGSSGNLRQEALRKAIEELRGLTERKAA